MVRIFIWLKKYLSIKHTFFADFRYYSIDEERQRRCRTPLRPNKKVSKSPSKSLPKFAFKKERKNLPHLKIPSYPTIRPVVPPTNACTIS
jgi:hypothetical protein